MNNLNDKTGHGLMPEELEKAANLLKAVAHPIRLSVIQLLEQNERLSVNEICDHLGTEQSLTSHHLSNMKLKGVLESKRDGQRIYYSIKIKEIVNLLNCMENCAYHFKK